MAKKKKSKPSLMTTVTAPIKKVGEFIADHMPTVGAAKPAKKAAAKKPAAKKAVAKKPAKKKAVAPKKAAAKAPAKKKAQKPEE